MTEVQKQQERLTALKAQRRELQSRLETAAGAEQAQLQLELAVCIEDMLSAAVVAKKAGAESKAKPSTPETPYDAWVSQGSGDNSAEHRRLKEAMDKIRSEGPRTAKQREFWALYNVEHLKMAKIASLALALRMVLDTEEGLIPKVSAICGIFIPSLYMRSSLC